MQLPSSPVVSISFACGALPEVYGFGVRGVWGGLLDNEACCNTNVAFLGDLTLSALKAAMMTMMTAAA